MFFITWERKAGSSSKKMTKLSGKQFEPAERDPGPGWLRSRFMHAPWPRPGVSACGRPGCPVCGETPTLIQCEAVEWHG